jgi:hypothetical protein
MVDALLLVVVGDGKCLEGVVKVFACGSCLLRTPHHTASALAMHDRLHYLRGSVTSSQGLSRIVCGTDSSVSSFSSAREHD